MWFGRTNPHSHNDPMNHPGIGAIASTVFSYHADGCPPHIVKAWPFCKHLSGQRQRPQTCATSLQVGEVLFLSAAQPIVFPWRGTRHLQTKERHPSWLWNNTTERKIAQTSTAVH